MNRIDLLPRDHRAERLLVLDLLAGGEPRFEGEVDVFLSVAPETLHPFLFLRLRNAALPPRLAAALKEAYRRAVLHDLRRRADLARVSAALDAAGIPFLVLKGPVLAATVYPERAARTMLDLDLLVAPEDLDRALQTMEAVGYRIPPQFAGVLFCAGDAPPLRHDQPGGPTLELHTMLESLTDVPNALAVSAPRARRVEVGPGLVVAALEPGEHFLQVAVHMSKKPRFRGELRSLLDVALLMRHEALQWDAVLAESDARALGGWILLAATLAHELLGAPLPSELARRRPADELLVLAAEQLWRGRRSNVTPRLVLAITGLTPPPVHARSLQIRGPAPPELGSGWARAESAFRRVVRRIQRVLSALARPRDLRSEVRGHRRAERLYAMLEARPAPRSD
jgi:hypothetical protein